MSKTAIVNTRIEPTLKREVETIFQELGLSTTQAVTLFFAHVRNYRGLPFELRLPNKETRKAIEQARRGNGVKKFRSVEELVNELES
ncbi:MAG: type II toxin-antitoxin system RelB/DinJ family antitoxin [Ignavibacteriae bacterium]|nr:type II toxin-antitoxin system RelB/DinJ family antitoxin [Ignavibacteriota bacterium]